MKTLKIKKNCIMLIGQKEGQSIADAHFIQHSERVFGVRVVVNGTSVANWTTGVSKAHCRRVFNKLKENKYCLATRLYSYNSPAAN